MSKSRSKRWFIALIAIVVVLLIVRIYRMPDADELPELVEEIEWEDIDRIEMTGQNDILIIREQGMYKLLQEDTSYAIADDKIINLFRTFNEFQRADLIAKDFSNWIKNKPDSAFMMLKLFKNTEEVLNLYITPGDKNTYFRYLDGRNIYQADPLKETEYQWIDSLTNSSI